MKKTFNISLISMPWPLFNRPSIQLATLRSYIQNNLNNIRVYSFHLYLDIAYRLGYRIYHAISERMWLSELIYASLLFPERKESLKRLYKRLVRRDSELKNLNFEILVDRIKGINEQILSGIDWKRFNLVGLSLCFSQLTSSLFAIRVIKEKNPLIKVVIGGSQCAGDMGRSLLSAFPEIDYCISGEGELPLSYLIEALIDGKRPHDIPGLYFREDGKIYGDGRGIQVENLDELPIPDFSPYLEFLKNHIDGSKRFIPRFPIEISRGCWWNRGGKGCRFCNLNLQWHGYRHKSSRRIQKEIKGITEKYHTLSISFMDNVIPVSILKEALKGLSFLKTDLNLFGELRAPIKLEDLMELWRSGLKRIQVGIEALSSSLLKKINKGVKLIENIQVMKYCEAHGTPQLEANLIMEFPLSDRKEVNETLKTIESVYIFRPIKAIPFWLGYDSPIHRDYKRFGLKGTYNHPYYSYIFPKDILKKLQLIVQSYRGNLRYQKEIWKPVKEKVRWWEETYWKLKKRAGSEPLLSYMDGGEFLIIKQLDPEGNDMSHRLRGDSRKIYLFCEEIRDVDEISDRFLHIPREQILRFLNMMVQKRLMFKEEDMFLSLAIPKDGWKIKLK